MPGMPRMPQIPRTPQKKAKSNRWLLVFLGIIIALAAIYFFSSSPTLTAPPAEISVSQLLDLINKETVERIDITGNLLEATLVDGQQVTAFKESQDSFDEILARHNIDPAKVKGGIFQREFTLQKTLGTAFNALGAIATVAFIFLMLRQSRNFGADIFAFTKSRARLFSGKDGRPQVKFSDAAGVEEAKRELQEVVDFLKNPQKYQKLGARVPKGVLLVGPAGTGKTLLAKATASEAGVPFFSMAGSEFMEILVGVGPSRVRDLFQTAKQSAPAIIFIDEIESIGRHRALSVTTHGEQEQTLNQILTEMDGFEPSTNVIVLAATNQPQLLDPALVRPGRFDRRIVLDLPDIEDREAIIKIHMRGKPFASDVNIRRLAQRTVGFSGADLENMLNEAAILAAREGQTKITSADLEESATKVELGPERKRLQSEKERSMAAYHEAGHAIVSFYLPHTDPVHRVSIVSRGLALGYTQITPQRDSYNQTKTELLEKICTLLGGRAAEEEQFGEMTIGAGNDLERASQIARAMVSEYGMSELGPLSFSVRAPVNGWPYNPYEESVSYSNEMAGKIDEQVKKIIDGCFARAKKILAGRREKLDLVAAELVKRETVEGAEFKAMMVSENSE